MKTAFPRVCLASLVAAGLTACSSTGAPIGAGAISGATQVNFTTWGASIGPGKTLVVAGDSQQGTYTFDVANNRVTARTIQTQEAGAVLTMAFTEIIPALSEFYTNNVRLQTMSGTDIRFARPENPDNFFSTVYGPFWGFESADTRTLLIVADPDLGENGFDYQSYGIWVTGIGTASGTYGATSVGAPTPASAVPAVGLATYEGTVAGRHVAANGSAFYTAATMNTSVDFFRRELNFTTNGTRQVTDVRALTVTLMPTLNMNGTLNILPNTNQFTGAITTNGGMTGTATGRFYGPAVQEIGGTFSVTGTGVQSYSGAFGGVKQ